MSAENDYADFPPLVMTFAASDPSGGSGMQADVLTLASMGVGAPTESPNDGQGRP